VYTAMGATRDTNLRNCDLAVEGSPSSSTFMSPRRLVPSGRHCRAGKGQGWREREEEMLMTDLREKGPGDRERRNMRSCVSRVVWWGLLLKGGEDKVSSAH
jgi:hypothetical protein